MTKKTQVHCAGAYRKAVSWHGSSEGFRDFSLPSHRTSFLYGSECRDCLSGRDISNRMFSSAMWHSRLNALSEHNYKQHERYTLIIAGLSTIYSY